MDGMSFAALQFGIVTVGGTVATLAGFYIKAEVFKNNTELKEQVIGKLNEFLLESARRDAHSDAARLDHEKRILVVENSHKSISDRLDSLVTAIWSDRRKQPAAGD